MSRARPPSPMLSTAMAAIEAAGETLIAKDSRFRHTFEAPVERIRPDPNQARKIFTEPEIAALAATMTEQGQLQPVLLRRDPEQRGSYILVAGERRWRAARLNQWPSILAMEYDGDPEVAALVENLQRVDLTPAEEARGLQRLIDGKGWTQAQAAEALGKTKGEISATLRILALPDAVLEVLTSELDVPRNVLVELARIEDLRLRDELVGLARAGGLTIRALRDAKQCERDRANARGEAGDAPVEGKPPDAVDKPRPPAGTRLTSHALDRVVAHLQILRETGKPVRPADRERLETLRREINALLGDDAADFAAGSN
jgi:ParB family transcriptional regulator, chromosome partitioning protein